MAVFNPQSPDVEPKYWGQLSKPITEPKYQAGAVSDYSAAKAGAAARDIGGMIEGTLKGADEVVKTYAKEQTQKAIDPIQGEFSEILTAQRAVIGLKQMAGSIPTADSTPTTTGAGGESLTTDGTGGQAAPAAVERGLANARSLDSSRAKGTISETHYYGKLDTALSDLRSRFPGYRDYIDSEVAKITGVHPANAYIKSILGDINSFITNTAAQKNHLLNEVASNLHFEGADRVWSGLQAGTISMDSAINFLAKNKAAEYQRKVSREAIQDQNNASSAIKDQARTGAAETAAGRVSEVFNAETTVSGLTGVKSYEDMVLAAHEGKIKPTTEQWEQAAQGLQAQIDRTEQKIYGDLRTVGSKGYSYSGVLQERTGEIVKEAMAPLHALRDAIRNKDTGAMYDTMRLVKSYEQDKTNEVQNGPMRDFLVASKILKDHLPPDQADAMQRATIKAGLTPLWKNYVDSLKTDAVLGNVDPRRPPKTKSVGEAIDGVAKTQEKYQTDPDVAARAAHNVLGLIDDKEGPSLANPNTNADTKYRIARYLFNERGWLNKVEGGKQDTYTRLTSPDVVKSIQTLSQRYPYAMREYEDWVKTTFAVDLVHKDLTEFKEGYSRRDIKAPYEITYNPVNHNFVVMSGNREVLPALNKPEAVLTPTERLSNSVHNINVGLQGLTNLSTAKGVNPDAYLVQVLDEEKVNMAGIRGIPEELLLAVAAAHQKKKTESDKGKANELR